MISYLIRENNMWVWLVLLYGIFKGLREICKKKALQISSPIEVLLVYSFISFVMVVPDFKNALGLPPKFYGYIAIKSFVIFVAWIFSFYAIKKLPISLYGVLDLSRVLFATFFGVTFLGEIMTPLQVTGLVLVCAGLISLKVNPGKWKQKRLEKKSADGNYSEQGDLSTKTSATSPTSAPASESSPTPTAQVPLTLYVIMAFLSCALNAVSGFLDKVLMKDITSSQLQFWYMLFLVIFYIIFALVSHQKIEVGKTLKNKWVWILSILFIIADRALFIANGMEESRVTVMTLIKQSGAIVTIVSGRVVFKEKGTVHKMICALIIIAGIFLGVLK